MSPDTILTSTQEQVLAAIAAGSTAAAAAASAGIHRNTVGNWLRSSPAFSHALACVHFDRALHWREQAQALAPDALLTMQAIMRDTSAPAAVRLKAAMAIFDKAATPLPPPPEPLQPDSVHNDAQQDAPPPTPSVRTEANPAPPEPPQPAESAPPTAPRQSAPKPGRNEPCPCGSGKKFKRCCLSAPLQSAASPPVSE